MPRQVLMLTVSGFFVAVGFGVMIPILPIFAQTFGVTNTQIGLVVSAFAAVRLATTPFCGRIADRLGHQNTIGAGMLLVAVSSVLMGLSQDYTQLLAWRALGGIGSAMFTVSAMALLLASVPHDLRGRASGLYQGGFLLGGMLGPAIGGLLSRISLTAPFFFYAATLLVSAAIAITQLHAPADEEPDDPPPARTLREVVGDVRYQAACALSFGQGWQSFGVRNSLIPVFIVSVLHGDPAWTGIAFAVAAVAQTAALVPVGRATDRIGRRPMMIVGGLLAGLSTLAIPFVGDIWLLIAVLCVYGVAAAALGTAPTAAVGDVVHGGGGTPIALYSMTTDLGAIIGPLVAGFLADRVGMPAAFGIGAAILVAGALWSTLMPREHRAPAMAGA